MVKIILFTYRVKSHDKILISNIIFLKLINDPSICQVLNHQTVYFPDHDLHGLPL